MRYFTADPHLGHDLVAATRGFISVKEPIEDINAFRHAMTKEEFHSLCHARKHDETLLKRFNARIGKHDELYILGDLSSSANADYVEAWLEKLHVPPARRHLVLGNHDDFKPSAKSRAMYARQFATVSRVEALTEHSFDGYGMVILSHLPDKDKMAGQKIDGAKNATAEKLARYAPQRMDNVLYLHGHTHARDPFEFGDHDSVNVGLDAWGVLPVSEEQIKDLLREAHSQEI